MAHVTTKTQPYSYPELVSKIEQGFIKVPAFQREFVWPMRDTLSLLDSIVRGYPIGTFVFWQTSEFLNSLRNVGDLQLSEPPSGHPVQYVLDGQQRITSIYAALRAARIGSVDYRIVVDLDAEPDGDGPFFLAEEPNGKALVALSDLLGNDYGPLFAELDTERQRRFNDVRNTFTGYQFSVTLVEGGDLDIVCDIFERINNTGQELSVFDLLVARTWSPPEEGGFDLREAFDELGDELASVGFDEVPEPVIAQLAGALVNGKCTRQATLRIGRSEMSQTWPLLASSLKAAVDYLRKKMRIYASRLLPYPSLLVPVAYFFAKNNLKNPDGEQSTWLERYFYSNGFAKRLTSGTQSKLTEDLRHLLALTEGDSPPFEIPLAIAPSDVRQAPLKIGNAYCKSLLCLLAAKQPTDFRDGSTVLLQNTALKQANSRHFHHIYPKKFIRGKLGADEVNSVANIALIPADLNLKIGAKAPSKYLAKFDTANPDWSECLRSHAIDQVARAALERDDFVAFLERRATLLSRLAHKAVGRRFTEDRAAA